MISMTPNNENVDNGIDWEHRILCSDGNCIGIIGKDGKCDECGKPFKGKPPASFGVKSKDETKETDLKKLHSENLLKTENSVDGQDKKIEDDPKELETDWDNRILCSDESCIGVVGPDGKCNECGRTLKKDKDP
jgi:hypothetical protein